MDRFTEAWIYERIASSVKTFEGVVTDIKNNHILWSEIAGVRTDGSEILCEDEETAEYVADTIENLCKDEDGDNYLICTGYYDPEEDMRDGCVDSYTDWWYVDIA